MLPDLFIPINTWVNLYEATGLPPGKALKVTNKTALNTFTWEGNEPPPSIPDPNHGEPMLYGEPRHNYDLSVGYWVLSSSASTAGNPQGRLSVQEWVDYSGSSSESGSGYALAASEHTIHLAYGETILVPDSSALLIDVILDMDEAIADCQIILPPPKKGRQVAFYFVHTGTQFLFTGSGPDETVSNGEVSVDKDNMVVFYCVSESKKIWARCAPL